MYNEQRLEMLHRDNRRMGTVPFRHGYEAQMWLVICSKHWLREELNFVDVVRDTCNPIDKKTEHQSIKKMYKIIRINVYTKNKTYITGTFSKSECLSFVLKNYIPGCGYVYSVLPVASLNKSISAN